jgi:hypothetical protein
MMKCRVDIVVADVWISHPEPVISIDKADEVVATLVEEHTKLLLRGHPAGHRNPLLCCIVGCPLLLFKRYLDAFLVAPINQNL